MVAAALADNFFVVGVTTPGGSAVAALAEIAAQMASLRTDAVGAVGAIV
jgi:hypothetical protein